MWNRSENLLPQKELCRDKQVHFINRVIIVNSWNNEKPLHILKKEREFKWLLWFLLCLKGVNKKWEGFPQKKDWQIEIG